MIVIAADIADALDRASGGGDLLRVCRVGLVTRLLAVRTWPEMRALIGRALPDVRR